VLATVHVTQNVQFEQQQPVLTHICSGQLQGIRVQCIIFDPKYCLDLKSRPHCCMHGTSILTEFLHDSVMLWEL